MNTPSDPYVPHRSPRRHAHHLAPADHRGRRARAARGRVPPRRGRPLPGDPDLRHLRQGPRLPGRLSAAVGEDGRRLSGDPGGLDQQVSELGDHRSRALGAARLRRRARGFPRRGLVARLHGSRQSARDRGSLPVHRVGGHAAVEQRQGGHARHLVLREQPVARGGTCIRRISPPSFRGKGRTTAIAIPATTAASCASSRSAGPSTRWRTSSTAGATRRRRIRTPANPWRARSRCPTRSWRRTAWTRSKS